MALYPGRILRPSLCNVIGYGKMFGEKSRKLIKAKGECPRSGKQKLEGLQVVAGPFLHPRHKNVLSGVIPFGAL